MPTEPHIIFHYITADSLLPSLSVIGQSYAAEVMASHHVMGGNTALLACQLPSFVADLVRVVGWVDDQGNEYLGSTSNYGNCQSFVIRQITFTPAFCVENY